MLGNGGNNYYGQQQYDPYYSSGYNNPQYYGATPSYAGYYPGYAQQAYYSQPTYSYSNYQDPLLETIPINELIGPGSGGYSSDLLRQVLAQGYEQGYNAGRYSRHSRLRNRYLRNLRSMDNNYFDPYSVTIGENRRVFAEGYSLGYQDAIAGRRDYASGSANNTDLFSLLLSNVIGLG